MSELGGAVQVVAHRAKQVEVLGGVGAVAVARGIDGMSGAPINTVAEVFNDFHIEQRDTVVLRVNAFAAVLVGL